MGAVAKKCAHYTNNYNCIHFNTVFINYIKSLSFSSLFSSDHIHKISFIIAQLQNNLKVLCKKEEEEEEGMCQCMCSAYVNATKWKLIFNVNWFDLMHEKIFKLDHCFQVYLVCHRCNDGPNDTAIWIDIINDESTRQKEEKLNSRYVLLLHIFTLQSFHEFSVSHKIWMPNVLIIHTYTHTRARTHSKKSVFWP